MPIILSCVPRARAYIAISDDARRAAAAGRRRRRAAEEAAPVVRDDEVDAFSTPFPSPIASGRGKGRGGMEAGCSMSEDYVISLVSVANTHPTTHCFGSTIVPRYIH